MGTHSHNRRYWELVKIYRHGNYTRAKFREFGKLRFRKPRRALGIQVFARLKLFYLSLRDIFASASAAFSSSISDSASAQLCFSVLVFFRFLGGFTFRLRNFQRNGMSDDMGNPYNPLTTAENTTHRSTMDATP